MMRYTLSLTNAARKQLHSLSERMQLRVRQKLDDLALDPFSQHLDIKKLQKRESYRLRVGEYRVIYLLENTRLIIEVINIGHRRHIYN